MTTAKPYEEEEDQEDQVEEHHQHSNHQPAQPPSAAGEETDYAYEDIDYPVTDGKDLGSYHDGGKFYTI